MSDPNDLIDIPLPSYVSPTLQRLPSSQQPKPSTACERCPASNWFASPKGLKAFCRVMHVMTWSTEEPQEITHCDGQVAALLELEAKMAEAAMR